MTTRFVRTPEDRFNDLADYPFAPHYVDIDGLRMHYLDEGPADAEPVLMLHGEPSWSYLYRHMIRPVADAGLRVIVPDLIGFGKSDKPVKRRDYTYAGHVDWMRQFVEALALERITLFCQDWGSLIGLRVAAENEARFARILLANGGLPDGRQEMPRAFHLWRTFSRFSPWFPIGRIIQSGTIAELGPDVIAAYDAPFPGRRFKAGARQFPSLVPVTPDDPASGANQAAWEKLGRWEKPFLTAFSDRDPITRGFDKVVQRHVPGAADQPHTVVRGAGHFLQEEKGPELARIIVDWMEAS